MAGHIGCAQQERGRSSHLHVAIAGIEGQPDWFCLICDCGNAVHFLRWHTTRPIPNPDNTPKLLSRPAVARSVPSMSHISGVYGASFFAHFDEVVTEVKGLSHIDESVKSAKAALGTAKESLNQARAAREKGERFIQEQVDRIELVSKHWFFGTTALQPQLWLRGGVEGKKTRAENKLEKARSEQPALEEAEKDMVEDVVPAAEMELARNERLAKRRLSLERERDQMRHAAIADNPSEAIIGMRAEVITLRQTIEATGGGAADCKCVAAMCGDACAHYDKASKLAADASAAEQAAEDLVGAAAAAHAHPRFELATSSPKDCSCCRCSSSTNQVAATRLFAALDSPSPLRYQYLR